MPSGLRPRPGPLDPDFYIVSHMKHHTGGKKKSIRETDVLGYPVAGIAALKAPSGRADEALRETNAFLKNILDSSSSISILSTDLEGNVLFWNKGAETYSDTTRRRWSDGRK